MKIIKIVLFICLLLNFIFYKSFNSKRESNLELLRIISMVLIVSHHFALYGYDFLGMPFSNKKIVLDFLVLGGKIGVNIFILIASYYLIDKKISYTNLLRLLCKVKLYAILFLILAFLFNKDIVRIKEIVRSFFPIVYQLWWFITAYFLLYISAPYLNLFLKSTSKNNLKRLLIMIAFIYIIISVFMGAKLFFSSFIWFIFLYIVAYYLKYYFIKIKVNKYFILSIYIIIYFSVLTFDYFGDKVQIFKVNSLYFIRENSIFSFLFSVGIFLMFLNLKLKNNKFVNYVSSGTLGIYLIHENSFVRDVLYQSILRNSKSLEYNFSLFIYHCVMSLLFIFCGTLFLGKTFDFFIENICFKLINFNKVEAYFNLKIKKILLYMNKFEK